MSINRVIISGNLTRDPEMRQSGAGTQILQFGMAVNDRRRNPQTGEWEDYANFVDCVVFGPRAEALQRILSKGTKVAIEGKLRYSSWETKEGQRRSKLEVVVDDVELMSRGGQQDGGYQGQGGYSQGQGGYQGQNQGGYGQNQGYVQGGYNQAPSFSAPAYAAPAPQPAPAYPASAPASGYASPAPQAAAPSVAPPPSDVYDEDIPF